jgi:hypothetical protein
MTAKKTAPKKKALSKKEVSELLKKGRGWDGFSANYSRLVNLYEWPMENVRLDIKIGLADGFKPDSNPTDEELKAAGFVEDPNATNAPKNVEERRFIEGVVRPALRKKLSEMSPAKILTEKQQIREVATRKVFKEEIDLHEDVGIDFNEKVNRRCGTIKTVRNAENRKNLFLEIFTAEWAKDGTKIDKDAVITHSIIRFKNEHGMVITERTAWNYLKNHPVEEKK